MNTKNDIKFSLSYRDEERQIETFTHEFSDLRELIMDKFNLDFFGECGGVGRCVTCLVVLNYDKQTEEFACQIPLDQLLNGCKIKVIGDRLNPR